jgi:ABC-2 type transport system ATP-binding protein
MPDEVVAVKVEHVSKDFVLPHEKVTTVKGLFTSALRRRRKTKEMLHALHDVSFEIKKGEFFGIVGRNGSGKSTMLKMLAGIYQPTKGNIHVAGKLVPFIELGVGFNPELTGRENVYLNGAMLGFSEKETAAMYDEIVAFAELEAFMDQKLKNYSSGMQVRLAFSMAIRSEADVLVIDEVLAVGDADFQRKCFRHFEQLKVSKKTVVFVSHDMSAIQQFCDRAVLIEKSKLVLDSTPPKVADAYTKMFVHMPPGSDVKASDDSVQRWGDGSITFTKVRARAADDDRFVIEATVTANKHIRRPRLGFAVKNFESTVIFGTNTDVARAEVRELHPGNEVKILWDMPNVLNDGVYTIVMAASYEGVTADWWETAAVVDIRKDKKTPYIINPPIRFTYTE